MSDHCHDVIEGRRRETKGKVFPVYSLGFLKLPPRTGGTIGGVKACTLWLIVENMQI
jgi:hypothetical protein